ncbi:MAG: polysaccharide biosynthesis protein, partial [Bacteroidetes bacterium]
TLLLLLPTFYKIRLQFDGALWRRMVRWAFPLVIVGLAGVVNQSIAVPLQKWRLGQDVMDNLAQAGVYAAAAKLALLMNLFAVAFNFAAEPFFFSHAERADARTIYSDVAHAFTIAACTLLLALTGWIELVQYLLGADFRAAIHLVPVLLFAYLMLGLYYNFSIWYKLSDHTWYGAWIAAGGAVVTFAINWFLLPQTGYAASAWAALACYTFMNAACLLLGRKLFPVPYRLRRMAAYLLITLALVALMQWGRATWPMALPWRLTLHSALVVLFLATAWWTDRPALLRYWKG